MNGSWNSDGRIVFAHDRGVSLVTMGKGECTLIIPAGDGGVTGVSFLPDGRIAYSRGSQTDMDVADAAGAAADDARPREGLTRGRPAGRSPDLGDWSTEPRRRGRKYPSGPRRSQH